jgi:hypothetical protein
MPSADRALVLCVCFSAACRVFMLYGTWYANVTFMPTAWIHVGWCEGISKKWVVSSAPCPLYPQGKRPIECKTGWAPVPLWPLLIREYSRAVYSLGRTWIWLMLSLEACKVTSGLQRICYWNAPLHVYKCVVWTGSKCSGCTLSCSWVLNLHSFLIVVLPCMLTITQLLLQQNSHFYY